MKDVKYKILFINLIKKWWLFLIVGICFGLLGILYAWIKEPVYTAKLSFTADMEKGGQLGLYSGLAAQFGIDLGGGGNSAFEGDNLIELLTSRTILEKTLLSKSPTNNKVMINEFIQNHFSKSKLKDTVFRNLDFENGLNVANRKRDSIINEVIKTLLKDKLSIQRRDKKLSYIDLSFKDNNEVFAKDFAMLLTSNAASYYVDYKSKKARKNFELLNSQCDSIRNLLFGNIEQIAESNDLNVNPLKQAVKTTSQKVQVNASANGALYTELLKQLGLARVNLLRETPLIQIVDSPILPLKKEKPGRLLMGILFSFIGGIVTLLVFIYLHVKSKLNTQS
ncbi:MAG: Wzz/FepE/Etk N-terminal domain-containing protein [Chitinophagaceae bacterium]